MLDRSLPSFSQLKKGTVYQDPLSRSILHMHTSSRAYGISLPKKRAKQHVSNHNREKSFEIELRFMANRGSTSATMKVNAAATNVVLKVTDQWKT
jgi:hypothetical protein